MRQQKIQIQDQTVPLITVQTLIIGTGAAGLSAAVNLLERGVRDLALVTDRWGGGTSNNAGSDKQTYYKLALAGDQPDSPRELARDLFDGGAMHGDVALCEAAHSAQAFYNLVRLGVPFPHNRYGEYVGYQTDHDARGRATSAGPWTSRLMCEALARELDRHEVPRFNHHDVIELLTDDSAGPRRVIGAVALDGRDADQPGMVVFNAPNVILATGGPAGIYGRSVYPTSQLGSIGMALRAGATAHNLTESQFGLASIQPRWNLSGSYQQALPSYFSTDAQGRDERELLTDVFPDFTALTRAIFLKGYQWPFDARKVRSFGSSLIDVLVYRETVERGRRVWLDFTRNPAADRFKLNELDPTARDFLRQSDASNETPFERLLALNPPAVELYRSKGVDLALERLEIAVCAQHCNGGLKADIWWESNLRGLFPIGEVNGTHGVYRPGGAALNAGQVGALRAASRIADHVTEPPNNGAFQSVAQTQLNRIVDFHRRLNEGTGAPPPDWSRERAELRARMDATGGIVRDGDRVKQAARDAWRQYSRLQKESSVRSPRELNAALKTLDLALTHAVYLDAINEALFQGGASRGSALVLDRRGAAPARGLEDWGFKLAESGQFAHDQILEVRLDDGLAVRKNWIVPRPIPDDDGWFESVWREFRMSKPPQRPASADL